MGNENSMIDEILFVEYAEGRVGNCERLNIRSAPSIEAEVLAVIEEGTTLEINLKESTDDWYCVCTPVGIEGFCMKQYVI